MEFFSSYCQYDDFLNINTSYYEEMVTQIYPTELQLNKANSADTEVPFLFLHLSVFNSFASSKIYYKGFGFDFVIVDFLFVVEQKR